MIAAHQQITDETGGTFVMLPLEEYNDLIDVILDARDAKNLPALRAASEGAERISIEVLREQLLGESRGEESFDATSEVSRL